MFQGEEVSHEATWNGRSLDALKDQKVGFEFFLKNTDLCTFFGV